MRPARHRHGLDGTDVPAEHGRRPTDLRPRLCPVPARRRPCPTTSWPPAASPATAAWTSSSTTPARSARPPPPARAAPTRARPRPLSAAAHPALFHARTHGFVDLSEDVSSKDLLAAVKEGYDSVELLKRFTTVTMGAAQGKLETVNAVAILAEATGRDIAATGTTIWRPPYAPITLGALAGRQFEPVRYSPMQSVARRPQRAAAGGRPVDPARALRRPGGRGAHRPGGRRDHRRDAAGQAGPARPGRAEAAGPALREQVGEARARARSATA